MSAFQGRALVVATPALRIPTSGAELVRLPFPPFWKEPKGDMTPPKGVIDAVVSWLEQPVKRRVE
jgi:hypothetical protein